MDWLRLSRNKSRLLLTGCIQLLGPIESAQLKGEGLAYLSVRTGTSASLILRIGLIPF